MGRVSVTGGDGFIGRRLVPQLLAAGHDVTLLEHRQELSGLFGSNVRIVRGDITLPDSLPAELFAADWVIHLAGCTIARKEREFFEVNHQGTVNVAQRCRERLSPPRFLFLSSLAAAGPSRPGRPHTERTPSHPISRYGQSKFLAEQALRAMASDLPAWILRPPSVVGDSDPYLLMFFRAAVSGWVVLAGSSVSFYSLVHVDDLVSALLFLMDGPRPIQGWEAGGEGPADAGELVYVAAEEPWSFPQLARAIREALELPAEFRTLHIPFSLCTLVGGANSLAARIFGHRPLLNLDKIREARGGNWCCDVGKLTKELGFHFQVSMEQRIAETARGYREKGKL